MNKRPINSSNQYVPGTCTRQVQYTCRSFFFSLSSLPGTYRTWYPIGRRCSAFCCRKLTLFPAGVLAHGRKDFLMSLRRNGYQGQTRSQLGRTLLVPGTSYSTCTRYHVVPNAWDRVIPVTPHSHSTVLANHISFCLRQQECTSNKRDIPNFRWIWC